MVQAQRLLYEAQMLLYDSQTEILVTYRTMLLSTYPPPQNVYPEV